MENRFYIDAEEVYHNECADHPLLSKEEEYFLIAEAQSGNYNAVKKLVESNQRLVMEIAKKYHSIGQDVEYLDLIQWGNIGLLRAISKFDVSKGVRFSTYAVWWIRSILRRNALIYANQMTVSCFATEVMAKMPNAISDLWQKLHRAPTKEEIAEKMRVPQKTLNTVWALHLDMELRSTSEPLWFNDDFKGDKKEFTVEEVIAADIDPIEDQILDKEKAEFVKKVLSMLPETERAVILLKFGFDGKTGRTYEEIGREIGKSRGRMQQIENCALKSLKTALTSLGYTAY